MHVPRHVLLSLDGARGLRESRSLRHVLKRIVVPICERGWAYVGKVEAYAEYDHDPVEEDV